MSYFLIKKRSVRYKIYVYTKFVVKLLHFSLLYFKKFSIQKLFDNIQRDNVTEKSRDIAFSVMVNNISYFRNIRNKLFLEILLPKYKTLILIFFYKYIFRIKDKNKSELSYC